MAQDTAAPANSTQDINVDDLEVEILIVAKNPAGLKQTCAFLSRRGWPTTVHGNLSKAIEEIAEKRPDIVMVSFNHPSPAVMRLPEIIAQTFNLICVGFVEGSDAPSSSKLNALRMRHKIFGTPSGPNFQRGIRRILAEKYNIKLDDKPKDEKAKKESNITVAGGKAGDELTMVQKSETGATANMGPTVVGGRPPGESAARESGIAYNPGQTSTGKTETGATLGKSQNIGPGGAATATNSVMQEGGGSGAAMSAMQNGLGSQAAASAVQNGVGDDIGSVMQMGQDHKKPGQSAEGPKRKKLKAVIGTGNPRAAAGNLLFGENLDPNVPAAAAASDLVGLVKKSLFENEPEASSPQSILEKAVENALTQICQRNPDIQPLVLKQVSKIGVFPVDSATIPGYLVIALENAAAEDQKRFLHNCENTLRGTFDSMGVAGKLESGFWLDVPEVAFEQWAENAGTFNFKMNHLAHEIGVSFFQTEKPLVKAKAAPEKGMHTISLVEISTEEPVTFKAYLHMKENNKFYLYLRNGRQLQPSQKQRLQENKIEELFMKTVDLQNLRIFLAAVYLKDTIRNTSREAA